MNTIDPAELRKRTEELLSAQTTMTLSTAHDNESWAAPVYYVNRKFQFYFFSDPSSRHVREALESGNAAAAVFHQASTWQEIRGIQMSGTVTPLGAGLEAVRAIRAYLKKFPFTREFFDSGKEIDLEGFVKRFRVRLYLFRPSVLLYQDNRIAFSFREEVALE
jgi:uncharacterized protein